MNTFDVCVTSFLYIGTIDVNERKYGCHAWGNIHTPFVKGQYDCNASVALVVFMCACFGQRRWMLRRIVIATWVKTRLRALHYK